MKKSSHFCSSVGDQQEDAFLPIATWLLFKKILFSSISQQLWTNAAIALRQSTYASISTATRPQGQSLLEPYIYIHLLFHRASSSLVIPILYIYIYLCVLFFREAGLGGQRILLEYTYRVLFSQGRDYGDFICSLTLCIQLLTESYNTFS
jgi:hypothetical protein